MNRNQARGWSPRGRRGSWNRMQGRGNPYAAPHSQPDRSSPQPGGGIHGPSADDFPGNKGGLSTGAMGSPHDMFPSSSSKYPQHKPAWGLEPRREWRSSESKDALSHAGKLKEGGNSAEVVETNSKEVNCSVTADSGREEDISLLSPPDLSHNLHKEVQRMQIGENHGKMTGNGNSYTSSSSEAKDKPLHIKSPICTSGHQKPELSERKAVDSSFDLCPPKVGGVPVLNKSLFEQKKALRRSREQPSEMVLRPGMVLLKRYISSNDQITIVKLCRDLGLGPGGFYQPGFRDGAKLHLKMMCLGKNWNPESKYDEEYRPHDGAKPPRIPVALLQLVESAIKDSNSFIRKTSKGNKDEDMLPSMTPDICLVNFYSSTGKLGLHRVGTQDCDESEQSRRKGLPVVSFSIGDAAEFWYGDDPKDVEQVKLESGDVLIFGGKSRDIFHGVASILPKSAPSLPEATEMRPGRLNLTFREY